MTGEILPTTVADQLTALVDILGALLGQSLIGVYVANDGMDDGADGSRLLLVLTHRDLLRDRKYGLVQTLLQRSGQPATLEVLVVRQADFAGEQASVLAQLHFTEAQREQLTSEVGNTAWLRWVDGPTGAVDRGTLLTRLEGNRALVGQSLDGLLRAQSAEDKTVSDVGWPSVPPGGQQLTLGNP